MRLYLIRHGETAHNRRRLLQGHDEVPLNDEGIAQCSRLAERMAGFPLSVIYSSDLRRTAMTAAILAARTGAPLIFDPLWRERDPGDLTNKTYEEAAPFFLDPGYHPPGGESPAQFERRIAEAAAQLLAKELAAGTGRHVAVVTHGMACAAFVKHALPGAAETPGLRWMNTALSILDHGPDGLWTPVVLGDASHLNGENYSFKGAPCRADSTVGVPALDAEGWRPGRDSKDLNGGAGGSPDASPHPKMIQEGSIP